ncbi:hypothetical protein BKA61DRAFT_322903 [Leptodontidium sp. MPI-SDFR-AT-0119]|nr:hypothetical protein BKA61DRAFT_322903 [Leptodontidium sp. MPI-SDFR-AT-0119]
MKQCLSLKIDPCQETCNVVILLAFILGTIFYFHPAHRFPQFDTSALKLYLNGTHPIQHLQSFAKDPHCEPAFQSNITTVTTTATQFITTTETQTCPLQLPPTPTQFILPPTLPLEELTPEQSIIARLRSSGITLIIKTGAQEVSHLSIQIGTTLLYLGPLDLLIFSDLQSSLGPFLIHDALRNVDQALKETDPDFAIYRDIWRYQRTGQDISDLNEERAKGDNRVGWKLDKYKFIHMVEQTFEMRPGSKWYVFVETDSYVVWSNLAEWLERLDSTKPIYLGAPVMLGGEAFAHGGSGYVLSNAAMNKLLGPDQPQGLAASWDKRMKSHCCGDLALAIALKEKGVDVQGAGPMLHGEKPATFSYGPGELWCQPVVTMHHVLPHEVSAIWRFERRREVLEPLANETIFADLYFHFIEPLLVDERENWDNLAHGTTYSAEETRKLEDKWAEEDRKDVEKDKEKEKEDAKKKDEEKVEAEKKKAKADEEEKKKAPVGSLAASSVEKEKDAKEKSGGKDEDKMFPETKEKSKDEKAKDNKPKDEQKKDSKPDQKLVPETTTPPKSPKKLSKRADHKKQTGVEKAAHLSFENCAKACTAKPECFQYVHGDAKCKLGHSFRLGKYAAPRMGIG